MKKKKHNTKEGKKEEGGKQHGWRTHRRVFCRKDGGGLVSASASHNPMTCGCRNDDATATAAS